MILEDLIKNYKFDNSSNECITTLDITNIEVWLKTVSGFANCKGGTFYIGVEDKTNKLIGFSKTDADNERNYIIKQVNEHLYPHPAVTFNFIPYKIREDELFIIQLDVLESNIKPVMCTINNAQYFFLRSDGYTTTASYDQLRYMFLKSEEKQYDSLLSKTEYHREDFSKLFNFYKNNNKDNTELTDKALQSMGFFEIDPKTNKKLLTNGAVLFMDNYNGHKTDIYVYTFSGFNKGASRIVNLERYTGNIIDTFQATLDFINLKMGHSIIKLDDRHIDIDAFPKRSLLEGLVNAIAHRDYYLSGTQIQVDLFKDRLEISSPGRFYMGENLSKTYDLSSIISKRRNQLICNVLVKCNVMEKAGTGFDKITQDYQTQDANHKPFITSYADHFTLVLPDMTFEEGIQDPLRVLIKALPITNGTSHDYKVLSFCYGNKKKASEIAQMLNIGNSTYFRKNVLENLVANEYLIKFEDGNITYYTTNRKLINVEN